MEHYKCIPKDQTQNITCKLAFELKYKSQSSKFVKSHSIFLINLQFLVLFRLKKYTTKVFKKQTKNNPSFKLLLSVFLLGNLSRWLPTTPRGSPSRRPTLCSTWFRGFRFWSTRTKKLRGAPWRQWPWSQRTSKEIQSQKNVRESESKMH